MLYKFQELDLMNDDVYICSGCGEKIQCFSESGITDFCCVCGWRNMDFETVEKEQAKN